MVTGNSVNPLSTVTVSPSGFNGAGASNTFEFTIPVSSNAAVTLPPIEDEGYPAIFNVAFENLTGANLGGGGVVYMYSNTATSVGTSLTGNLVISGTPSTAQINVAKASGTNSLQFTLNNGGLTAGAKVRVTRIA